MDRNQPTIGRRSVLKSTIAALGAAGVADTAAADSTDLVVSAAEPGSVSNSTLALRGSVDDMGGADTVDVTFEWRRDGTVFSWNTTRTETLTTASSVRHHLDDLIGGVTYEYRITATASDGASVTGPIRTVTTDETVSLTAETRTASDVTDTSATVNGTVSSVPDGGATVRFRWGPTGPSGDLPANTTASIAVDGFTEFSQEITGLDPDTEYDFIAVAESESDIDRGARLSVGDGTVPTLVISTGVQRDTFDTGTTLAGSVDDLGGADSVDVFFEWRPVGASAWNTTSTQTLTSTGSVTADLTGLAEDSEYEFRLVGTATDGDTDEGTLRSFYTTGDPLVETDAASEIGETSARFNGRLPSNGGSAGDLSFEWGPEGEFSNTVTDVQTEDSDGFGITIGAFYADVSGLDPNTTYNYRAVFDADDGDSDTGEPVTFSTDQANVAPAVDGLSLSTADKPNPHAAVTVDWAVSDGDGNLDTVTVEVSDGASTVDSARIAVSGSSASGTERFDIKRGGNTTYDVRVVVTDTATLSDSDTASVTAA
jgi:subtilisin